MSQIYIRGLVQVGVECLQDYPDHKNKKVRHKSLSRLNNSNFLLLGVFIIKPSAVSSGDLFQWRNLLHFDTGRGGADWFPSQTISLYCRRCVWVFPEYACCGLDSKRIVLGLFLHPDKRCLSTTDIWAFQPSLAKVKSGWRQATMNLTILLNTSRAFPSLHFDSLFLSLFERMLGQLFILFTLLIFHFPASFIFFFSFHIFPSRLWPLPSMTYLWPFWDYLLYLGFEVWCFNCFYWTVFQVVLSSWPFH